MDKLVSSQKENCESSTQIEFYQNEIQQLRSKLHSQTINVDQTSE